MTPRRQFTSVRSTLAAFLLLASATPSTQAWQDMGPTRNLWDTEFVQKRPPASAARKTPVYKRTKRPARTAPAKQPAQTEPLGAADSVVGVTVWRLRPSKSTEQGVARLLVHEKEGDSGIEWTPERLDTNMPIAEGQRVRLAVEVPRDGYLYVVDRERYADGSQSKNYLVFPTKRLHGGSNAVSAGSVVEIPGQTDTPGYLTLVRSRADQVAEELVLLVTPTPLDGVQVGDEATELSSEKVAEWEREWGGTFEQLDLENGKGMTYTQAELRAGAGAKLTQADPVPQTIFKVAAKPGSPFLVRLPLRIQ